MNEEKKYKIITEDEWEKMEQEFAKLDKDPNIKLFDSWWDNIKFEISYFFSSLATGFRSIVQGLKNLWEWKGIIWRNRWYDSQYLFDIQKKQLEYMRDNWHQSHYEGWEKEKETLDTLVQILEDIEKYDNELNQEMKNKKFQEFGRLLYDTKEEVRTWKDKNGKIRIHRTNLPNFERLWD